MNIRAVAVPWHANTLPIWMVWHRDIWDHLSVSPTCLDDRLCALQSPIVLQYQLLNCLRSAAERFLFLVLICGTNYQKKSPLRHLYLSTFQRHLKTFLFRKSFPDIIADWHFSGPCGNLNYLGHSKKFWLIDWLTLDNKCSEGTWFLALAHGWQPFLWVQGGI